MHPTPDELRERIAKLADKLDGGRQGRAADARALLLQRSRARDGARSRHERAAARRAAPAPVRAAGEADRRRARRVSERRVLARQRRGSPPPTSRSTRASSSMRRGVAVLASSSGSELSQESEQLQVVVLHASLARRPARRGRHQRDGLVTVDEAYRYAYHQTLLATAETAVGGQHVSLEVDLKGHGEVPLSFPRAATAHIELPAALEGKTLSRTSARTRSSPRPTRRRAPRSASRSRPASIA